MSGPATPPPETIDADQARAETSNRLERAVALLMECVDLLRSEMDDARNDGAQAREGGPR